MAAPPGGIAEIIDEMAFFRGNSPLMNRLTAIGLASLVAYGLLIASKYTGVVSAAREEAMSQATSGESSARRQRRRGRGRPDAPLRPRADACARVPRREPAHASAVALEFRSARDLKAFADALSARRDELTADERYHLAQGARGMPVRHLDQRGPRRLRREAAPPVPRRPADRGPAQHQAHRRLRGRGQHATLRPLPGHQDLAEGHRRPVPRGRPAGRSARPGAHPRRGAEQDAHQPAGRRQPDAAARDHGRHVAHHRPARDARPRGDDHRRPVPLAVARW